MNFPWPGRLHRLSNRGELRVPRRLVTELRDPDAFVAALGQLHEAMEDLTSLPTGGKKRLILSHEIGSYGALWAYANGAPGHHIGVPPETWPNLVAAANRRSLISALVHEAGHVAMWWDWSYPEQAHYLMWGGAVEGTATPTGAYACVRYNQVPAWIDFPDGSRDWATLADFWHEIVRGGLESRRNGVLGQDSATMRGHGEGALIVESTLWDLLFRVLGSYDAYRTVLHHYVAELRTREQAAQDDPAKLAQFFTLLGRAAGQDLSPYLAKWGYDVTQIRAACRDLPECTAELPDPPPPLYA